MVLGWSLSLLSLLHPHPALCVGEPMATSYPVASVMTNFDAALNNGVSLLASGPPSS